MATSSPPAAVQKQTPSALMITKQRPEIDQEKDPVAWRETLEFVRAYYRIEDPAVRKRLRELIGAVASATE